MVPERHHHFYPRSSIAGYLRFFYCLLIPTKDDTGILCAKGMRTSPVLLAVQEALQKCEALESLLADERMRLMSRVEEACSCREREDAILGRCRFVGNIQGVEWFFMIFPLRQVTTSK